MPAIVMMFVTTMLLTQMFLTCYFEAREKGLKTTIKCFFTRNYQRVAFDSGIILMLVAINLAGIVFHVHMGL